MKLRNKISDKVKNIKILVGDKEYVFGSIYEIIEWLTKYTEYEIEQPLIKDEKIRKAVREWAWANNIDEIDHWQGQLTGRKAGCNRGRAKIQFNRALGFNYGCGFNIAELCGEEEE